MTYDVGVVELHEEPDLDGYGELVDLGAVEKLAGATGRNRNNALVETVGYGIQSVQPHPQDVETRYKSTSRIVEVTGKKSASGNLHTSNNPSVVGGKGGSCFGDSGGPVFINDTNLVLAVVSFGPSATCHGADYSWRVDTESSYDFLEQYLYSGRSVQSASSKPPRGRVGGRPCSCEPLRQSADRTSWSM